MTTLLTQLRSRGCTHDASHFEELESALEGKPMSFYCGFDPTADSLHVGSMLPLLLMRRLQNKGHRPIALLGSGTGMIGDPSGKSEERKLLDQELLAHNVRGIEKQVGLFLDSKGENSFKIVQNGDWLAQLNLIEFLRDVGKHFTVNGMIAKDSVRSRLENREQGISFTEFSYMLLQAYDFYHLYREEKCRLQVGGSDQWGNITAGLELIRRKNQSDADQAFGLTFPLLTTSTGAKFGKTEQGAVWLDPKRTSPYRFYQYWLNTTDADVITYLKLFTEIDDKELAAYTDAISTAPQERLGQKELASQLTTLVHGADECVRAQNAAKVLFGESFENLDSATLSDIFSDVPSTEISKQDAASGIALQDLLTSSGLASSKGAARRLIEGGGVYVNNKRVEDFRQVVSIDQFVEEAVLVLRSGKKKFHLIRLT